MACPKVFRTAIFSQEKYSPSALLARAPSDARVEVLVSQNNEFYGDEARRQSIKIKLTSLLETAANPHKSWLLESLESKVYAAQVPAGPETVLGKLLDTQGLRPHFVPKKHTSHVWISAGPSTTPPHYDDSDNALMVCHGSKTVKLAPFSAGLLGTLPLSSASANHIKPNETICFTQTIQLHPMDILYIPAGTWHTVSSDAGTVGINFWWSRKKHDLTSYHDLLYLVRRTLSTELTRCTLFLLKGYLPHGSLRDALTSTNKLARSHALHKLKTCNDPSLKAHLISMANRNKFTLRDHAFSMALWLLKNLDLVSILFSQDAPEWKAIVTCLRCNRDSFMRFSFRFLAARHLLASSAFLPPFSLSRRRRHHLRIYKWRRRGSSGVINYRAALRSSHCHRLKS